MKTKIKFPLIMSFNNSGISLIKIVGIINAIHGLQQAHNRLITNNLKEAIKRLEGRPISSINRRG